MSHVSELLKRIAGFAEMQEVVAGVWIGPQRAAGKVAALEAAGITHVLTANGQPPRLLLAMAARKMTALQNLVLELDDEPEEDIASTFPTAIAFIQKALAEGGGVLVHCTAGISRSCTIVCAYLMATQRISVEEALHVVRSARKWVKPNPGFIAQLTQYEMEVLHGGQASPSCELCRLRKTTHWHDEKDARFVVIDCDSCDLPMVVWRPHSMTVCERTQETMEAALAAVADEVFGEGKWRIDKVQRTIFDHMHWHARPPLPWQMRSKL
eukprot:PLAT5321.2.p1 GENE.PLAT5321.2~~PLAT5321.2.p1  ORF type:complete len:268 (-),score=14.82 PLAT5321.2:72-875(-)